MMIYGATRRPPAYLVAQDPTREHASLTFDLKL